MTGALKIRDAWSDYCVFDKQNGGFVQFYPNKCQQYVIQRVVDQMLTNQRVQLVIVKARQVGITTLCNAWLMECIRYYLSSVNALLVSRTQSGARDLFKKFSFMFQRVYPRIPINKVSLSLPGNNVNCGWEDMRLGLRGETYNFIHVTEAECFQDWERFMCGIRPTLMDRHFLFIESTARGHGNMYDLYKANHMECIFLPWYWMDGYRSPVRSDFKLEDRHSKMQELHHLTNEQMQWYIDTEKDLGILGMKYEYPTEIDDCFVIEKDNRFFELPIVEEAFERKPDKSKYKEYPVCIGIDPSIHGDKTAIVFAQGNRVHKMLLLPPAGSIDGLIEMLVEHINRTPLYCDGANYSVVKVDAGGIGVGVPRDLCVKGIKNVIGVMFGEQAVENQERKGFGLIKRFMNRRAELYFHAKDWLKTGSISTELRHEFETQIRFIKTASKPGDPLLLMPKNQCPYSPDLIDAFVLAVDSVRQIPHVYIPNSVCRTIFD